MSSRSFCAISQKRCACSRRSGSRRITEPSRVTGNTMFSGAAIRFMLSFRTSVFESLSCDRTLRVNPVLRLRRQPSHGRHPERSRSSGEARELARRTTLTLLSCISRPFQASLLRRGILLTCDDFTRPTIGHGTRDPALLRGESLVKAHCLPFSQIPHTTRLFTDFLEYLPNVQPFYPRSPHFKEWLQEEAARISYDSARRGRVRAILEPQNKSWDASPQTL